MSICPFPAPRRSALPPPGSARTFSREEREPAHLDACSGGPTSWEGRVGEGGVGHTSGSATVGVVCLEDNDLVRRHVGVVVPAVGRAVGIAGGVVTDVSRTALLGDGGHRHLVLRCDGTGVAHGQREVLWGR